MNIIKFLKEKYQHKKFRDQFKKLHLLEKGKFKFKYRYPQYDYGYGSYGTPLVEHGDKEVHLKIGSFCSIAGGVKILLGGNHNTNAITTFPFYERLPGVVKNNETKGDVVIGSDVWLASDCLILSGVTIGHGAVVAARAVVTKDIPPYAIVGGNPAKIIRYRFSDDLIRELLSDPWWELPHEEIITIASLLCGENIQTLLDYMQSRKK